ncbi:MAG: diguanylate cyclase [Sulfurimonas sp.]|jgi:diguanylate cyclase (GGDEF)-like protein
MERILIIEDNKTLAKLIAKKISTELNFEVDVAYQLSEAKLFLQRYKYFVTLTDLNLPDAPNGEVVDYLLSKECRVIVLSGNIDKDFREKILKKNIIDYINKAGVEDINYIIHTIRRLHMNQLHKVLIVDDSMVFRKSMKAMLENLFFQVLTVAHGEEAMGMINTHPDISLVLTDYNMPVMNGLELTKEIRKLHNKNDMSIIALSSNEDEQITAMFLKSGANDYIKKPFSKEEFSCRVNNAIEALENIFIITNHANRDFLTGLYNRRYFFKNIEPYFNEATQNGESFAIAMIDIDHFKKINETYGHDTGDKVIVNLSEILRSSISQKDIVARFSAEVFCLVLKDISAHNILVALERLRANIERNTMSSDKGEEIRFTISIGVSISHEDTLQEDIDQADLLLYNAKQGGRNQIVHN